MTNLRKIHSFVRRSCRLTPSQQKGLTDFWQEYGIEDLDKQFDFKKIFNNDKSVILEIGFGNGDSLVEMAKDNQDFNYLGIEVYEAGLGRCVASAKKLELKNIKVINGDAVEILKNNIFDNSLSGLQLFFPDPWHKKKHHKRRIVNNEFLQLISKKLKKESFFHLATDWLDYAEYMMETITNNKNFKNTQPAYKYSDRPDTRPLTKFERRGQNLEHGVWDLIFTNVGGL